MSPDAVGTSIVTGAAVLFAPLVALCLERWRRRREHEKRWKTDILIAVIRNRSASVAPEAVPQSAEALEQALNEVPVAFRGERQVIAAWETAYDAATSRSDAANGSLTNLIMTMVRSMGLRGMELSHVEHVFLVRPRR